MKNSICFITCVNDENLYSKCLQHIEDLQVPDGLTYETLAIRNAKSMTSAYNYAIQKSDAKYKVYLHQDTFIINKNFIQDIIEIFLNRPQIGLIGVVGTKSMPTCCNWGRSHEKFGNLIQGMADGTLKKRNFINDESKIVTCVDGLIMITQYDIRWREDIFDGWHFYDISQCMEFNRLGYQVCVPYQNTPWCIHDCGQINFNNYDKYRYIFLKEYFNDLFKQNYLLIFLLNKFYDKTRPFIKRIETAVKYYVKVIVNFYIKSTFFLV